MTFLIDIWICYSDYPYVNFHVIACIYGGAIRNLYDSYNSHMDMQFMYDFFLFVYGHAIRIIHK